MDSVNSVLLSKAYNPEILDSSPLSTLIAKAFDLDEKALNGKELEKGEKLLNQKFRSWELAREEGGNLSLIGGVKTFFIWLFRGKSLVKNVKAHQKLLKNPTNITKAVKCVVDLTNKGETIDFEQYAKMDSIIPVFSSKDAHPKLLGNYPEECNHYQSLIEFQKAFHAISQYAKTFDVQKQFVAAVIFNIAQKVNISGGYEGKILVDQMSHLWIKTKSISGETSLAVSHSVDEIAKTLDFENSNISCELKAMHKKVLNHAALFANAELIDQTTDLNNLVLKKNQYENQIWNRLNKEKSLKVKIKKIKRSFLSFLSLIQVL